MKLLFISLSLFLTIPKVFAQTSDSWVAIHIFDSIYPMTDTQTFPEALNSLEIIHQIYSEKSIFSKNKTGTRSREGHFLIWAHFSESFLKINPIDRQAVGDALFLCVSLFPWTGRVENHTRADFWWCACRLGYLFSFFQAPQWNCIEQEVSWARAQTKLIATTHESLYKIDCSLLAGGQLGVLLDGNSGSGDSYRHAVRGWLLS